MPCGREFRRILRPGGEYFVTLPYEKARVQSGYYDIEASMVWAIVDEFRLSHHGLECFGYCLDEWRSAGPDVLVDATSNDTHHAKWFDTDFAAGARGVTCMYFTA
jgi:hypothetical protein